MAVLYLGFQMCEDLTGGERRGDGKGGAGSANRLVGVESSSIQRKVRIIQLSR